MKKATLFIPVLFAMLLAQAGFSQPDWSRVLQIGTNGLQNINAVDADADNVYMAASISGTLTFDDANYQGIGFRDLLISKISNIGESVWIKQFNAQANGTIFANAMKVDATGNIFVVGTFFGTTTIGVNTITSGPFSNAFLAKFDASGNGLWVIPFLSTGTGSSKIALDENGNNFLQSKTTKLIKFSNSGEILWEQSFPDRTLQSVAVYDSKLYIGGTLQGTTNFGALTLVALGGYNNGYLVKADMDGNYTNSVVVGGSTNGDGSSVSDIVIDHSGNIIMTGGFTKDLILGDITITNSEQSFYTYIAKCDQNFTFSWAKSSSQLTDNYRSIWTYRIFLDDSNNIYEYGMNSCSFTFGSINISGNSGNQFLIKFDADGNATNSYALQNTTYEKTICTPIGKVLTGGSYNYSGATSYGNLYLAQYQNDMNVDWQKVSTNSLSSGSVSINYIKHDSDGNTYALARVVGSYNNLGTTISSNTYITVISKVDIFGNVLWINKIGDISPRLFGSSFILDKDNNVLIVGLFQTSLDIGNTKLTSSSSWSVGYVAKYSSSGDFLWASALNLENKISDNITVASDNEGNVLVSGVTDPANYIVKFDAAGNQLWAKSFPMESHYISLIAADANNNIYLTSEIHLADGSGSTTIGTIPLTQTNTDGATVLVKFDPDGNALWANTYGGVTDALTSDGWPCDIKTDKNGNSYIWGWCSNNAIFGTITLTNPFPSNRGYSFFLAKLNSSGGVEWARAVYEKKLGFNYGDLLDLDNDGNVYVGGHLKDAINVEGVEYYPQGANDFFIAKYSNSGDFQWIKTVPANNDILKGLSVYKDDILSVAGYAGIYSKLGDFNIDRKSGSNCMIATLGDLSTAKNEIANPEISISPNPAKTTLFVRGLSPDEMISIIDFNGKVLVNKQIAGSQLDVMNLVNGIYLIKITGNRRIKTRVFIKQ